MELIITWMASGDLACRVPSASVALVAEVRSKVAALTGVPSHQQRLFHEGTELTGSVIAPAKTEAVSDCCVICLELVRCSSDPRNTNLAFFSGMAKFEKLADAGSFTFVRHLSKAIHGEVILYNWTAPGGEMPLQVAVKKMKNDKVYQNHGAETDAWKTHLDRRRARARNPEDAETEIAILSYLKAQTDAPPYLLRMFGCFQDESSTWLVVEYAEGGELFALANSEVGLDEDCIRRYLWQLLIAVSYLHSHDIGHRDISLENVLLKDNKIRLMDFGMAVQSHSSAGEELRYFCRVGKDAYRAPECYVPEVSNHQVFLPVDSEAVNPGDIISTELCGYLCQVRLGPDAGKGKRCSVDLWGYAVQPADVFATGVCLCSLAYRVQPWKFAVPGGPDKCEFFSYIHSRGANGLEALLSHWGLLETSNGLRPLSQEGVALLLAMVRSDPARRPTAAECLALPWFQRCELSAVTY